MATVTAKRLYLGVLSDTSAAIYTSPASTVSVIHSMVIHNTNTTAETVVLKQNNGTSDFVLYSRSIAAGDTIHIELSGEGMVLESGDILKGNSTTASVVNISVNGSTVTA